MIFLRFGTVFHEFPADCWLDSLAWNKSGTLGFAAGKNATIAVLDNKGKKADVFKCKHSQVMLIVPIGDNLFLSICYDRNVLEYEKK